MDLKDFITETIRAITDATSELQETYEPQDIIINPPSAQSGSDVYQQGSPNYTMRRVQNVAFDVAVSASSESDKGGKAAINVLSLTLGAEASKAVSAEQVSRVSFSIPMTLKPSKDEGKNIAKREQEKSESDEQFRELNSSF